MPSLALSNITSVWATNASSWSLAVLHASYYDAGLLSEPEDTRKPDSVQESSIQSSVVNVNLSSPWYGPQGAWYAASIDLHATMQGVMNGERWGNVWQQTRSTFLPDINRFDYGFRLPPACSYSGEPFPKADNISTQDSHCAEWGLPRTGNDAVLYSQSLDLRFSDWLQPLAYQREYAASRHQQWRQSFSIERDRTHDADWLGLSPEAVHLTAPVHEISVNESLAALGDHQDSTIYSVFANSQKERAYHWSWGYTAGSVKDQIPASLVIGGADVGQILLKEGKKFLMSRDPSRRFKISIHALNITKLPGSTDLEARSVVKPDSNLPPATIDTTTPFFLLPPEICDSMRDILGATNSANEDYLISAERHRSLTMSNTTISLWLAQRDALGNVLRDIHLSMPYQDLVWPLDFRNGTAGTQVLAIKKILNTDRTVLGRTLLQKVHLMADYEQGQFTLSPTFPPGKYSRPVLQTMDDIRRSVEIMKTQQEHPYADPDPASTAEESRRSSFLPVMLGTLGVVFALTIVVGLPCCFWLRRRKRRQRDAERAREEEMKKTVMEGIFDKPELAGRPKSFMESDSTLVHESPTDTVRHEMGDKDESHMTVKEMAAEVPVYEMAADEIVRSPPKSYQSR